MSTSNPIIDNPLALFDWISDLITSLGANVKDFLTKYFIGFPPNYNVLQRDNILALFGAILLAFLICSFFTRRRIN